MYAWCVLCFFPHFVWIRNHLIMVFFCCRYIWRVSRAATAAVVRWCVHDDGFFCLASPIFMNNIIVENGIYSTFFQQLTPWSVEKNMYWEKRL
jgi:hypothetical protein